MKKQITIFLVVLSVLKINHNMTKFEELSEAITRKRNQTNNCEEDNNDFELEVAGSESSKTPLLSCGDDDIDGSIIDDLYRKPRHKPLMGQFVKSPPAMRMFLAFVDTY